MWIQTLKEKYKAYKAKYNYNVQMIDSTKYVTKGKTICVSM